MFRSPLLRRTLGAALRDVASRSAGTRASALRDLAHHAEEARPEVIHALERALSDEAPEVRAASATALADVRAVEALPALLFAVEDDDGYVRQMALSAIGELGDPRACEKLRRSLSDPRPEVRYQGLIAFTRVAPEQAAQAIDEAFADLDPSIRYIAIRCAEERTLGCDRPLPVALLARMESLVEDPDPMVRIGAAIVLARSGDRRGVPILIDVAKGQLTTREEEDEAAAVELLGTLGISEATPHLERRAFGVLGISEGRFAWQALVALARLGHRRARSRIVRDLGSWSRDRRTLAVAAAGRAHLGEARVLIEAMKGDESRADASAVELALAVLGGQGRLLTGGARS